MKVVYVTDMCIFFLTGKYLCCFSVALSVFIFILFFGQRGNLGISSQNCAHACHACKFLSILMPKSTGGCKFQQNDCLKELNCEQLTFGGIFEKR
jgi:hypothetical protein